jgi:hypothetical protein
LKIRAGTLPGSDPANVSGIVSSGFIPGKISGIALSGYISGKFSIIVLSGFVPAKVSGILSSRYVPGQVSGIVFDVVGLVHRLVDRFCSFLQLLFWAKCYKTFYVRNLRIFVIS